MPAAAVIRRDHPVKGMTSKERMVHWCFPHPYLG